MTELRRRMIEDMELRGFSPKTRKAYVEEWGHTYTFDNVKCVGVTPLTFIIWSFVCSCTEVLRQPYAASCRASREEFRLREHLQEGVRRCSPNLFP